jgi:hypothetical protein
VSASCFDGIIVSFQNLIKNDISIFYIYFHFFINLNKLENFSENSTTPMNFFRNKIEIFVSDITQAGGHSTVKNLLTQSISGIILKFYLSNLVYFKLNKNQLIKIIEIDSTIFSEFFQKLNCKEDDIKRNLIPLELVESFISADSELVMSDTLPRMVHLFGKQNMLSLISWLMGIRGHDRVLRMQIENFIGNSKNRENSDENFFFWNFEKK